jgi:hypothetical protein
VLGGPQDSPLETGPPRRLQPPRPTEVLAATSADKHRPIQHAGAVDRLGARMSGLVVLDQALADLEWKHVHGAYLLRVAWRSKVS